MCITGAFPSRYGGRLSSVLDVKSLEETRAGAHGTAEVSLLSSSLFTGGTVAQGKLSWNVGGAAHVRRQGRRVDSRQQRFSVSLPGRRSSARRLLLPNGGTLGLTTYAGKDLLYHQDETRRDPQRPWWCRSNVPSDDDETVTFDWGNRVAGLTLDQPLGARTIAVAATRVHALQHALRPAGRVGLSGAERDASCSSAARSRMPAIVTRSPPATRHRDTARRIASRSRWDGNNDDDVSFPDPLATDGDTTMRQRPAMAARVRRRPVEA